MKSKIFTIILLAIVSFAFWSTPVWAQVSSRVELNFSDGSTNGSSEIVFGNGSGFTINLDPGFDSGIFGDEPDPVGGAVSSLRTYNMLVDGSNRDVGFAIQSLPDANIGDTTIEIGANVTTNTNITFDATLTTFPVGHRVIVEDRDLGVFIELQDLGDSYVVDMGSTEPELGRFFLHTTTDTTAPAGPGSVDNLNSPTNQINNSLTGSCGVDTSLGSVVVTTTPANGFSNLYNTRVSLNSNGDFSIANPNWSEGVYQVNLDCTDKVGNGPSSFSFSSFEVDLTAPTTPAIDSVIAGDKTISGTGEENSTITLDISCTNNPITVSGGFWTCNIGDNDLPKKDETITVSSSDAAGNDSENSVGVNSGSSGNSKRSSEPRFSSCRDNKALNYNRFGKHDESLCEYAATQIADENSYEDIIEGSECSEDTQVKNNLRNGARDGQFDTFSDEIVSDVALLQDHINRLLVEKYGDQAAGPVDGIFGPMTKLGVQRLQQVLNETLFNQAPLVIDGIVGKHTKNAINMSC